MRKGLQGLIGVLALCLMASVILGYGGGLIYELDALAHFRLHVGYAVPFFAAVAIGLRHWQALWRTLVAGVLAFAGTGPLWEQPFLVPSKNTISVMTANLYQVNRVPEKMKAAILAVNADILVTNETNKSVMQGTPSLATEYPHRLSLQTNGTVLRTVIWSKFPMRDGRLFLEDRVEPTGASAIIEVAPDIEISVLGVHLAHPVIGNQQEQIEALDRIAEGLPAPRIVMGDFNATPWSWAMTQIQRNTGTRRIPGYRVTWHGRYPSMLGTLRGPLGQPIDHILLSEDLAVDSIRRVQIPGSDHLGVLSRIVIPDESQL